MNNRIKKDLRGGDMLGVQIVLPDTPTSPRTN